MLCPYAYLWWFFVNQLAGRYGRSGGFPTMAFSKYAANRRRNESMRGRLHAPFLSISGSSYSFSSGLDQFESSIHFFLFFSTTA